MCIRDSFRGVDREEKVEECRENLTRGGHAFGVYDGDRLVALAETTAENSVSAMVVGVATLPGLSLIHIDVYKRQLFYRWARQSGHGAGGCAP